MLRWPIRRTDRSKPIQSILVTYFIAVWALWVWLSSEPNAVFPLQEAGVRVAISPDGNSLALQLFRLDKDGFIGAGPRICVLDRYSGKQRASFKDFPGGVLELSWISNDLLSAVLYENASKIRPGVSYCLWDVRAAAQVACLDLNDAAALNRMFYVAVSPDARTLAYTTYRASEKSLKIWDLSSRSVRQVFPGEYRVPVFSPDGKCLAAVTLSTPSRERITLWDVASGKVVLELEEPKVEWEGEEQHVHAGQLSFSADGRKLAIVNLIYPVDQQKQITIQRLRKTYGEGEPSPSYLVQWWDLSTRRLQDRRFHWCVHHDPLAAKTMESLSLLNWRPSRSTLGLVDPHDGSETLSMAVKGRFGQGWAEGPTFDLHTTAQGSILLLEQNYGRRTNILSRIPYLKASTFYEENILKLYDRRDGHRMGTLRNQRFGCLSDDGRLLATFSELEDALNLWELPLKTPWSAILAWALLPAGLIGMAGAIRRKIRGQRQMDTGQSRPP